MLFFNTTGDFVLMCLLASFSGAAVITTHLFHALIPIPSLGGIAFIPISHACLIIARKKTSAPLAALGTKILQWGVIFFLPGGSPLMKNPVLFPLMILDGFFLDLLSAFSSSKYHKTSLSSGFIMFTAATTAMIIQGAALYVIMGPQSFYFQNGFLFFINAFILFHGLLKFIGGVIGWHISEKIPVRNA